MGKKFKLKDFLYQIRELTLLADVVVEGETIKNYPVGTVKLRGIADPVYTKRSFEVLEEFREKITADSSQKEIREATEMAQLDAVIIAIEGWDVDLFDMPFSKESAREVFSTPEYNIFYNQIAKYIEDRRHFLPNASQ